MQPSFSSSHIEAGGGLRLLRSKGFKLAAEAYDLDDGLTRLSPPLERQIVNWRPSPSPDYLPPPERSPTPERPSRSSNSKKKRRPRAQASQGDAVLISFMGGLNHPDLATKAGEEPLPQSDDSDLDEQMDVEGKVYQDSSTLVQLAENALPLVESKVGRTEDQPSSPKTESIRPPRPKIDTQAQSSMSKDETSKVPDQSQNTPKHSTNRNTRSTEDVSKASHSPSRSLSPRKDDSDSVAISPMLRRFTIPNLGRSPTETLPAMHNSPPSTSSKSPSGQQNLPSLRAIALEPLLDSRSPNEIASHGISRPPFAISNGTLNSPPVSSITPRPGQYASPQTRMNGHFHSPYPHGVPSPAYSDASPRDSTNMSPPTGKPASQVFSPSRRTPQSEELTPQSAESHHSTSSFSTAPSPHPHPMDIDCTRPTLPPLAGLQSGPLMTGSFKCDHVGCTAAPFQTQYLLK